jgi:phage-related protein
LNATLAAGEDMVAEFGGGADTAAEKLAQMRASVQNMKDSIGIALLPVLKAVLEPLTQLAQIVGPMLVSWAEKFTAAIEQLPGMFDQLMELDAFNEMLSVLSDWWNEHGPSLINAAQELFGILRDQIGELVTSQIIPFLVEQFEKFSAWWSENGDLIAQALIDLATIHIPNLANSVIEMWQIVEPLLSGLVDVVLLSVELIAQIIEGDWDAAWRTAVGILAEVLDAMRLALDGLFNWIATEIMGTTLEQIRQQWADNWDMAAIILQTWVNDTLVSLAEFAGRWINDFDTMWAQLSEKFSNWVNDMLVGLTEGIVSWVNRLKEGNTEIQRVMADGLNDALMSAVEKARKFVRIGNAIIESMVSGVRAKASALANAASQAVSEALARARSMVENFTSNLPGFQRGGITPGGPVIAGEQGPEIIIPPRGSSVLPAGMTRNVINNVTNEYNLTTQAVTRPGSLQMEFDAMAAMGAR